MAPNSLHPAYIRVDYHTAYAPHVMLLPLQNWNPASITGDLGSCIGWNSTPIDAEVMVNALLDEVAVFYKDTAAFDLATVFTIADPDLPIAIPRASVALAQVGSSASSFQAKAVQNVFTFRTEEAHVLKLYLLDAPTIGGAFEKVTRSAWNADMIAVETQIKGDGNAWAGRDGAQVSTGISVTSTLNEKLRKAYRMT